MVTGGQEDLVFESRMQEHQGGIIWLIDSSLGFPSPLPTEMQKPTQCRWHISLIQTEVQATDASGTEGKGDFYISPTATTPMTNFSHWAYWTKSKETCSFQALGTLWYLKVGRSKPAFLDKECLCRGSCREKEWAEKWISQGFRMGRIYSVLHLPREHILINLSQGHSPLQWQKPSQANYLHIRVCVRMVPVLLFLILYVMQKWLITEQAQFSFCLWSGEIKMPKFKLRNCVKV